MMCVGVRARKRSCGVYGESEVAVLAVVVVFVVFGGNAKWGRWASAPGSGWVAMGTRQAGKVSCLGRRGWASSP